jgi:hypothetical protein
MAARPDVRTPLSVNHSVRLCLRGGICRFCLFHRAASTFLDQTRNSCRSHSEESDATQTYTPFHSRSGTRCCRNSARNRNRHAGRQHTDYVAAHGTYTADLLSGYSRFWKKLYNAP